MTDRRAWGRIRRDHLSWWAEAGYEGRGYLRSTATCTKWGAKWKARRLKRRLEKGIEEVTEYV